MSRKFLHGPCVVPYRNEVVIENRAYILNRMIGGFGIRHGFVRIGLQQALGVHPDMRLTVVIKFPRHQFASFASTAVDKTANF